MAQINISNTLWNDTSGGVLVYAKQVQDNEADYSKYSRITSEIINRFHLNTKFQTRLNDFFLNLYDEFCTGMDKVTGDVMRLNGAQPNDVTCSQTDATFVHKENGTITNLFYLRQATSQLAGLLSATMYNKLNNLPSKDQIPVFVGDNILEGIETLKAQIEEEGYDFFDGYYIYTYVP